MSTDRFGRTPEQAKNDQRLILEKAYQTYPGWVDAKGARQESVERFDIHDLIDHGLLQAERLSPGHGIVGDSSFIPMYRLSARGHDRIREPQWLDHNYPRSVHITAVASSINVNSPHASATTHANVNILVRLQEEIERSDLPPEEKAGLLDAIGKLLRHPLVLVLLTKLSGGGG